MALVVIVLSGCGADAPRAAREVVVAVDTSGSARPLLPAYVAGLKQVAMRMAPVPDQTLAVYRFDRQPHELFRGPRPISLEHLVGRVVGELSPPASQSGTVPSAMLERVVRLSQSEASGPPIILVVMTDGGDDDLSSRAAARAQQVALDIAEDPRIERVVFAGVKTGLREAVRDRYAAMGPKLLVAELEALAEVAR